MGLIIQVQTVSNQLVEIDLGWTFPSPVAVPVAVAAAVVGAAFMPRSLARSSIAPLLSIAPLILPLPVSPARSSTTRTAARLTLIASLRRLGGCTLSFRG
jgi:hypothetical protein